MNKVILMGRLTKDPELSYTSVKNMPVCKFTLAVDRQFVQQGQERQADFISMVAWSKTAEFCSKYFTKGLKVAVVGRIQTRTWDDKEGKKQYSTEVIVEEAHFAEGRKSQGSYNETSYEAARPQRKEPEPVEPEFTEDIDDDGLPF